MVEGYLTRAGLREVWAQVLDLTRTMFPLAHSITAYLEDDPDIAGQCYLVCDVQTDMEASRGSDAWEEWHRRVSLVVPAAAAGVFRLRLELRD